MCVQEVVGAANLKLDILKEVEEIKSVEGEVKTIMKGSFEKLKFIQANSLTALLNGELTVEIGQLNSCLVGEEESDE